MTLPYDWLMTIGIPLDIVCFWRQSYHDHISSWSVGDCDFFYVTENAGYTPTFTGISATILNHNNLIGQKNGSRTRYQVRGVWYDEDEMIKLIKMKEFL